MYSIVLCLFTNFVIYLDNLLFTGKCAAKNTLVGSNASIMSIEFDDLVSV